MKNISVILVKIKNLERNKFRKQKLKYPQILKKSNFENLWIMWIVISEADFHRFLQHLRRP